MRHSVAWTLAPVTVLAMFAEEMVPPAIMAAALVAFFAWRARARQRMLADAEDNRRAG